MDSFVFGEPVEEKPAVPESVIQNLLLKVRQLAHSCSSLVQGTHAEYMHVHCTS